MLGDVCPLKAPASAQVRWVVLLQDDLHDGLGTRVAAPLLPAEEVPRPVRGLNPSVRFQDADWRVMIPDLASLTAREIGAPVTNLADARPALLAAIDLRAPGI